MALQNISFIITW